MASEKRTKRILDALRASKPSKVGIKVREHFVWDRELHGFGVQVMPLGIKSFVIDYRTTEGRNRRAVIGRYGLMTVEIARKHAHGKLVSVSKGFDPIADDANAAGLLTVTEVFDLDLHRFRSGQVLMLGGPLFEGHG